MDIRGFIIMVCLLHVTYAPDPSACLTQYNACLSGFGITATGSNPLPAEIDLYTESVMNALCPHIGVFVDCYDHTMKCIQGNHTSPEILSNVQLTHMMDTTCMHKAVLVSGHDCLVRINYTAIQTGCTNKTQAMIAKLIGAGVSIKEVLRRSVEMNASCMFSSPKLLSCGNDLLAALKAISNVSLEIFSETGSTTVASSVVG